MNEWREFLIDKYKYHRVKFRRLQYSRENNLEATVNIDQVDNIFKCLNFRKSAGPNRINYGIL